MDSNATPANVGSNDGLGQDPERYDLYEDVIAKLRFDPLTRSEQHALLGCIEAAERARLKADAEDWGDALNSAGWAVTEAYRKHTGKVEPVCFFNHAKAILRDGIAAYFAALKA